MLQRGGVDVVADVRRGHVQQRLLLAGEERAALVGVGVQRLDAEPVAGAEQHPLLRVPDQEGEHAAQFAHDLLAEVVVARDDRLAVALGLERRTELAGQPLAQFEVVVDLAVEDQVVAAVEPGQRLVRVVDVDDRQPAEADRDVVVVQTPPSSGPAVAHVVQRGLDARRATPRVAVGREESDQSAHAVQYHGLRRRHDAPMSPVEVRVVQRPAICRSRTS